MTKFADAIEAIDTGLRVRRESWPKERKFIFKQVPATIPSSVVPKMQSLPETVKSYFKDTFEKEQISEIYYVDQIAEVGESNLITGFAASPADILATDWKILDRRL